jgi:hypothetical protein
MKFQAQRIREIESELVGLHLTCAEVVRVMSEQRAVARAVERLRSAV